MQTNVMRYMSETGVEKEVSVAELFGWVWDDFIRGNLSREFTRGLLHDLGLNSYDVFHMMELLGLGKEEYEKADYRSIAYV